MKKPEMLFTPMTAKPGEEVGFYFGRLELFVKHVEDSRKDSTIPVRRCERKRVTKTRKAKKGSR